MRRFHEEWAIVATIDPVDGNAVDPETDVIDMSKYHELAAVVMTGVVAASGTLDFALHGSANSDGSSAALITGKSITQFTATDDGKQAIISLKAEELSATQRYVKGVMDNSAHSQLCAVVIFGRKKYESQTEDDLSTVDEIVL